MLAAQQLEEKIKNKNITWIEPNGGFTIWLTMNNLNLTYEEINRILRSNKIRLAIGRDFFLQSEKKKHFRLSIASLDEKEIIEGIDRLKKAVKQIYAY